MLHLLSLLALAAAAAAAVAAARAFAARGASHASREARLLAPSPWTLHPAALAVAPLAAAAAAVAERAAGALTPTCVTLLSRHAAGGLATALAAAAVDLGLPDAVAAAPHPPTAAALAAALGLGCDASAPGRVFRLLRACAQVGLFRDADASFFVTRARVMPSPLTTRWRNTRASAALRSTHPRSLAAVVALSGLLAREAWPHLAAAVRDGRAGGGFAGAHGGAGLFEWLATRPADHALFHAAMAEAAFIDAPIVSAVLRAAAACSETAGESDGTAGRGRPPLPRQFVDVGGGEGAFLSALLTRCPTASGVLFDLPHVAFDAAKRLAPASLVARVDVVGGSFFDAGALPPLAAGDCVTLRFVLHDWDDDQAADILACLRRAVGAARAAPADGGAVASLSSVCPPVTLCVIDMAPSETAVDDGFRTGLQDANMMAAVGGRERTAREVGRLMRAAGWAPVVAVAAVGPVTVVAGVAV